MRPMTVYGHGTVSRRCCMPAQEAASSPTDASHKGFDCPSGAEGTGVWFMHHPLAVV